MNDAIGIKFLLRSIKVVPKDKEYLLTAYCYFYTQRNGSWESDCYWKATSLL